MHESERLEIELRNAGAHGYVLKSQAARDLVRAIDALLDGNTFYGAPSETTKPENDKAGPQTLFCQALAFA